MNVSKPTEQEPLEQQPSELTRRDALKLGAITGAAAIITSRKSLAAGEILEDEYPPADPVPQPTPCGTQPTASPPTRPFVQQLPIMEPARRKSLLIPPPTLRANTLFREAARADHQRWTEFPPRDFYEFRARTGLHRFHPDLPETFIWGFDGVVPGRTIIARYGNPVLLRLHNFLPANHVGFGIPEITLHLHNGHTASESDGFASEFYGPGFWKDLHYPNVLAGYDQFPSTKGDVREAMHTLWAHDHRHSFTRPNTYRGLSFFYFLYDHIDSGDENDRSSTALRLPAPYGQYDIPLLIADKLFCPDGQLFLANGDKFTVNGAIQPTFKVQRRKYRFRLLNVGPTRAYTFGLTHSLPFKVIATDGNLLRSPIDVASLNIQVAERYDFIIDFSQFPIGEKIYMTTNPTQSVGHSSPDPLPNGLTIEQILMQFHVTSDPPRPDASRVPAILTEYPTLPSPAELAALPVRTWDFDLVNGVFQINGQIFDENVSLANMTQGTGERWILRNKVPLSGWTHPVHIHFEEFRVLSRNGAAPPPLETGRKDVIRLGPNDEIELFMRFRDFKGKYMMHCHQMGHEDNFMLIRWDIVSPPRATSTPTVIKDEGEPA
jgi:FtsP/CotA-like multicopper oxidase with cupredoxin domain